MRFLVHVHIPVFVHLYMLVCSCMMQVCASLADALAYLEGLYVVHRGVWCCSQKPVRSCSTLLLYDLGCMWCIGVELSPAT